MQSSVGKKVQGVGWWRDGIMAENRGPRETKRRRQMTNPGTKFRPQKSKRPPPSIGLDFGGRTRNHKVEEKLNHEDMG
jgi:hypothetical protein